MEQKYKEIIELYKYTCSIGVKCELIEYYDGYKIKFLKSGGDCVQHKYSYNSEDGCVEFNTGIGNMDLMPTKLKPAKYYVKRHEREL